MATIIKPPTARPPQPQLTPQARRKLGEIIGALNWFSARGFDLSIEKTANGWGVTLHRAAAKPQRPASPEIPMNPS